MHIPLRVSVSLAVLACALGMDAQTSTGSIYGKVTDPHGLLVPGATVRVTNTDQSSVRTVTTDGRGGFHLAGLVPGAYSVEADKTPLKLRRPLRLTVGLGSSTELVIKLDVVSVKQGARAGAGERGASATVTARAATAEGNTTTPPINESEASVSTFFAGTVVTYLPNRDRDVRQFDPLSAEAHETAEGVSVDGQRTAVLLTEVDGVDFNSALFGASQGVEDRGFVLPQTVVREFQLVSSGVGAEVGGTNSGLVNVATKEGSNRLHGEAFYTVRPSVLTSADAFGNKPKDLMKNFGWSDGGAIRKNRTFFYAGFEQDLLHAPRFTEFAPQATGVVVPGNLSLLQGQIDEYDTPLALSGRIDEIVNAHNTLNLEVAGDRVRARNIGDGGTRTLGTASTSASESGQSLFVRLGLTSVPGPRAVNEALVAWRSDHRGVTPNSTAPETWINGYGVLGGDALGPHLSTAATLQLSDALTLSRGKSLYVAGGSWMDQPSYEQREENLNGRFDYNSLGAYLSGQPRRFQQTFVTGSTLYQATVRQAALYGTAQVELRAGLTLTAGLRWAGQWNPQPSAPNPAIAQTQHIANDLAQWQPRAGVAWSANKKTVVRASAGLYDAATPATLFHRVFADNGLHTVTGDSYFDPVLLSLAMAGTNSPVALSGVPNGLTTPHALVEGMDAGFRNPRALQAALTVDETISPKLTLRAGYVHTGSWRLERVVDENLAPPTLNGQGVPVFTSPRPIAGFGRVLVTGSTAHSSYEGGEFSVISQISRRTQVTANYTLAKTVDDDSSEGPYSLSTALNPYALKAERADSNLDVRSVLNVAGIFNLPAGFKLNPLIVAQSAAPYTGLIGFDTQNDANDWNDRAVVNGAETPRNLYRGPAFLDSDVRVVKDFTLKGEGHHLDLFMDIFNVLGNSNRNFGPDQVSLFGSAASPVASAGQALYAPGVTRIGGPREFQFTARLVGF